MMQYANRYRHSHADIKAAIDKSLYLFTKEYRYQDALDEIRDSFGTRRTRCFQADRELLFQES